MRTQYERPLSRRRFLGGLTLEGWRGSWDCTPSRLPQSRRPKPRRSGWTSARASVPPRSMSPRSCCGAKDLSMCPTLSWNCPGL